MLFKLPAGCVTASCHRLGLAFRPQGLVFDDDSDSVQMIASVGVWEVPTWGLAGCWALQAVGWIRRASGLLRLVSIQLSSGPGGWLGGAWERLCREWYRVPQDLECLLQDGQGRGGRGAGRRRSGLRIWRRLRQPAVRRVVWLRRPALWRWQLQLPNRVELTVAARTARL